MLMNRCCSEEGTLCALYPFCMAGVSVPLLYRHILKAAKAFPSKKRNSVLEEIKNEFHANKVSIHMLDKEARNARFAGCDTSTLSLQY